MTIDKDTKDDPRPDAAEDATAETAGASADTERYLRLLAEFDNFRRRSIRERDGAFEDGVAELARPLLAVLDNLERAMGHADGVPPAWLEGMTLTLRQFREALKGAGVEAVEPVGEPFDPRFHEALTTRTTADVPEGHVADVVTRGYRIGERVLRPAQVVVAHAPGGEA